MVVVNKPGAGGPVAASQLVRTDAKVGTASGVQPGNALTNLPITGRENQFDPHGVQGPGAVYLAPVRGKVQAFMEGAHPSAATPTGPARCLATGNSGRAS